MTDPAETRALMKAQRDLVNDVIAEWVARLEDAYHWDVVRQKDLKAILEDMRAFAKMPPGPPSG